MNKGFVRVAAAVPELRVADCAFNAACMTKLILQGETEKVQVICFPELSITGYTCADLFFQYQLLEDAEKALKELQMLTFSTSAAIIVGMPVRIHNQLFNTAVVLQGGHILGVVPKTHLPNQNEYYEKRWFSSGFDSDTTSILLCGEQVPFGIDLLFSDGKFTFGIEICEDLWMPIPPSSQLTLHGAEIIFNLSASNELIGKHKYRRQLIEQQSARCNAGYVYASSGAGESTTDMVFSGNGIIAENGKMLVESERFSFEPQLSISEIDIERLLADRIRNGNFNKDKSDKVYRIIRIEDAQFTHFELKRTFDKFPFVPSLDHRDESCHEIFAIQVGGLAKRWLHSQSENLVVGISGGLDSTLALLVCIKTADKLGFDRKRIIGITMPGFGTTDRTYTNACELMKSLGISMLEISIKDACIQHFKDIDHDPKVHNVTYENTQARERTQILMDIANKQNGLVIGTGDLSELALGWATYNGDHMSMYAVNSGVPKTLVRYLVDWAAQQVDNTSKTILQDILNTPVSPELLPADKNGDIAQKTEQLVGPYELHDFYLYYFVRFGFSPEKILLMAKLAFADLYSEEIIKKWLKVFIKRFFSQQFKRSCMPDGPKVGSINLSPRGDWRMPSDAIAFETFLAE
ncbi:MAG: NAD(+) synthase [Paludibacter sp.]|nr:NAD(+) synthase [Paludibacter sp.]